MANNSRLQHVGGSRRPKHETPSSVEAVFMSMGRNTIAAKTER